MALRCCVRNTDNLAAKKNATDMFFRHMDTILKVLLMWLAKRDSLYRFPSNELSETNLFFKKFDFCFRDINNIWNERENEKPIKWNSISFWPKRQRWFANNLDNDNTARWNPHHDNSLVMKLCIKHTKQGFAMFIIGRTKGGGGSASCWAY